MKPRPLWIGTRQHLEESRRHAAPTGLHEPARRRDRRAIFRRHVVGKSPLAEWIGRRRGDRLDSRNGRQPCNRFLEECLALRLRVLTLGEIERHGQHVGRVEADIDARQPREAAHQQERCDEQQHRQRHLHADERVGPPTAARRGATPRRPKRGLKIRARRMERRRQPEANRREQRHAARDCEGAAIHVRAPAERQKIRQKRRQGVECPRRGEHSESPADSREQDALGHELAHQAAALGTKRHADAHLPLTARRARDQQAGDVCAAQYHQHADRAEQHPHHAPKPGTDQPVRRA